VLSSKILTGAAYRLVVAEFVWIQRALRHNALVQSFAVNAIEVPSLVVDMIRTR
jgi:hypothetical protein